MLLDKGCHEGDDLDRLSQAHLVCEDGVLLIVPFVVEPVQTVQLVFHQLTTN